MSDIQKLNDQVHTWIWRYEHAPFDLTLDSESEKYIAPMVMQWNEDMTRDLQTLIIPAELERTIYEYQLKHVISLAQAKQSSHLKEIYKLLMPLQQYVATQVANARNVGMNTTAVEAERLS